MALAAQPPMHFPSGNNTRDLSWDETIVPVLRQRLQNESQILSKRLSTHSISSSSGADVAKARTNTKTVNNAVSGRQSAIPRPSLSQDRKDVPSTTTTTAKRRQRTNSTPFQSQIPSTPPTERPTRIPKVTAKGTPTSNSYHPYKSATLNGSLNGSGSVTSKTRGKVPDFMEPPSPFDPQFDTATSGSGSTRGTRQGGAKGVRSYIRDEEPPFPNSASTSTEFHYEQTRLLNSSNVNAGLHSRMGTMNSSIDDSRPSGDGNPSDSDRPFEHWYRGEAARNGGVGELKIGRKEMLDIAQFGHKPRPTYDRSSPLGMHTTGGLRRRAGSVDEKRESWIMDENAYKMSKVIDESPLTDLEGDEYTTEGERAYPYPGKVNGDIGLAIHDSMGGANYNDSVDDDIVMGTTPTAERTMAASYPSHASARGSSETSANSPQSQKENMLRQASSAAGSSGKVPLGANNGVKSSIPGSLPSKPGLTGPAKAKTKAKPAPRKLSRTEEEKQSQEGADAPNTVNVEKIPYRLPPAKGNWDDIVLPAVSKKMGIEGYGLKSEGGDITEISEEVRKRMSVLHPSVPGLFGYDMSKYRSPEEDINMAVLNVSQPSPPSTPKANGPSLPPTEELAMRPETGRDSPLAFSHYQANLPPVAEKNAKRKSGIPAITISPPSADEHAKQRPEEDKNSGCCGCVIM